MPHIVWFLSPLAGFPVFQPSRGSISQNSFNAAYLKGTFSMRHSLTWFAICHVSLAILTFTSGCYSMNGYVMNSSGQAFYKQGNYAMAAAEFEKAVASAPTNPDYIANLARTHYKMGDSRGAEQIYRRNLTTSPGHQPSYHGLAELMMAHGRQQEAMAMLTTWSATQPYVAESHVELAWLQRELGQRDAAGQSLLQALRANPGHPKALAHLGQYYQDAGQTRQAIAMYQQSLQSDWSQPHVHSRLSSAIASIGPTHPVNAPAMAGGMGAQGAGRRIAARPYSQMQLSQVTPSVGTPSMSSFAQTFHPLEMPVGTEPAFTTPVPEPLGPDEAALTNPVQQPIPDPVSEAQVASPTPVTSVSHQPLTLPDPVESIPEVEAF